MAEKRVGIIMNGVTGRMGANQHLKRSIVAIRDQGGVKLDDGTVVMPDPLLVGRNEAKLRALAEETGVENFTTDLDAALADDGYEVYFDASTTQARVRGVRQAIEAGKHVYCEKPSADNLDDALDLYRKARAAGVKNGVVQNKLWLPGLQKLMRLRDEGFFGRLLSVRAEFGYWVFDGAGEYDCQRPSWNYRAEDGGGIIVDMLCHWRYVIDNLVGNVRKATCLGATHIPERVDERGKKYRCTAEDAAYSTFITDNDVVCHFNSSWVVRVRRDDLLTVQIEGTKGSAVAGLHDCMVQSLEDTPLVVWNPDLEKSVDYFSHWKPYLPGEKFDNAFKSQWELFLRHVAFDEPFRWSLLEGARGLQLAEKGLESWEKGCWVELEDLEG